MVKNLENPDPVGAKRPHIPLLILSASFGTLSIASHATIIGIPVGIAGASLTLIFTLTTGVVKKLLNITRKKKKKTIK